MESFTTRKRRFQNRAFKVKKIGEIKMLMPIIKDIEVLEDDDLFNTRYKEEITKEEVGE